MLKYIGLFILIVICKQKVISQELDSAKVSKHPILEDRYYVNFGFFPTSKSVILDIDGNLPNNPIDFGQTLGLKRQENTFAIDFNWRFSKQKKWSFGFEYFSVNNTQTAVLEEEFKWRNTIYPIGVQVDSGFEIQLYRIFFGRVISMGNKHEFRGGIGLHTMNIKTFIQGKTYFGDLDIVLDTDKRKIDVIAPVPNIGFSYLYAPHIRWDLSAKVDWFSIAIGDYSGTLWNLAPSVSFKVKDYLGIGVGYRYFKAKFNINRKVWKGGADLLYQGPLFMISGNF